MYACMLEEDYEWNCVVLRYNVAILGDLEETCDQTTCLTAHVHQDIYVYGLRTWPIQPDMAKKIYMHDPIYHMARVEVRPRFSDLQSDTLRKPNPISSRKTWEIAEPKLRYVRSALGSRSLPDCFSWPHTQHLIRSNSRATLNFKLYHYWRPEFSCTFLFREPSHEYSLYIFSCICNGLF